MVTEVKKQLRISWKDMLYVYLAIVIFSVIGFGIGILLYRSEPGEGYAPVGMLMASIIGTMLLLIISIVQYRIHFYVSISMGIPRKTFFWANTWNVLLLHLGALLIWIGTGFLELSVWRMLFPKAVLAQEFQNIIPFTLKYGAFVIGGEVFIGNLCAALWLHLGRIGGAILWILWMVLCIGGPRAFDTGIESAAVRFFTTVPKAALIAGYAALLAIILAGTYICIRRQEVRG